MFRKFMLLAGVVGMITAAGAQTIIPGGNVSGTWAASGSPFLIMGEITVPSGQTLNIEPSVQVIFQGHYKLIVNGLLQAIGTEQDSILFSAANTVEGWHGIRFIDAEDGSHLTFCIIQYGKATGTTSDDLCGGGIYSSCSKPVIKRCRMSNNEALAENPPWMGGGGIYLLNGSDAVLDSCIFTGNSAYHGGAIHCQESNPEIKHCSFSANTASGDAGAIFCNNSAPVIQNCLISNCTSPAAGAIFFRTNSNAIISDCEIQNNQAPGSGGGIYCEDSNPIIRNNVIRANTAGYGGGIYCISSFPLSHPMIINNLIIENSAAYLGGAINSNGESAQLIGNTIINNSASVGGAIYSVGSSLVIYDCILWGNSSAIAGSPQINYSCVQNGWPGIGNISLDPLFTAGPEGEYYLSQLAAGQSQNSPCVDTGDPASPMIDGTTRTDGVQDSGIVDMGFHYAASNPPPPVQISLIPLFEPIFIYPWGGEVGYYLNLQNNTTAPQTFDVWVDILLPDSSVYGPLIMRNDITFAPSQHISRLVVQSIPAAAPSGRYFMRGHVGDYQTQDIWSEDSFPFTKVDYNDGLNGQPVSGWTVSGWDDDIGMTNDLHPSSFILHPCSPNPFNPTTVASYELRVASHISFRVYDTAGRLVATLVDGWREAGSHEVTFDASDLAAGIYFARLRAGEYVGVEKLILLK